MRRSLSLLMQDFENEQSGLSIEMNYCCQDNVSPLSRQRFSFSS